MKLLTFYRENQLTLGVKLDKGILDLSKAAELDGSLPDFPESIEGVMAYGTSAVKDLIKSVENHPGNGLFLREEEVQFGPCVPKPGKIICVGLNYRKHAEESGMPVPESPVLFNKFANAISAHRSVIDIDVHSDQVDYEAELAVVIGKRAKDVAKEEALDYVFGYCVANDISARDLQMRTSQWLLGKTCDGFCPVGPYLVTSDEVEDPNALAIKTYVNGEIRQNSNTSDMIFSCDEIISYLSRYMTLEPGDVILTGTPEGVVMGYPADKQIWLQDGDEVTIEIERLGTLVNRMKKDR